MKVEKIPKSVKRAIAILNCFSPNELELDIKSICQKTKIPKATVYRIMGALTEARFIYRNENSGKFGIGLELFVLGSLFLSSLNIIKIAEPVVKSLTEMTNEAFHLGILDGGNMVLLMREESNQPVKVALPLGAIRPAYASGMGKALLSELTDEEIDILYLEEKLHQVTKYTIATRTDLKRDLKQIKKTGVSFDVWGASEGATGIASVIRDTNGKAVAAAGVAIPDSRLNHAERDKFAKVVKSGANLISYGLGFKNKDNPVYDFEEIRSWWEQEYTNSSDIALFPTSTTY